MNYLTPRNSFSKDKRYIPYQNKIHGSSKTSAKPTYILPKRIPKSFSTAYRNERILKYCTRERLFNSTVNRQVGVIPYMIESKYYTCSNCKEFGYE